MLGDVVSINGKVVPAKEAKVSIDNIEFTYGFGVYENLKVRKRVLYFLERHSERLLHSASVIGLKTALTEEKIQKNILEFVKEIREESFNVKVLLLGKKEDADLYIMALSPKFLPKKNYTQGVKVTFFYGERQFVQAKTLNMLMSYVAFKSAKEHDAYDALMVHPDGTIVEGTRTNFFFTDGKTIFTAPEDEVLNGVTRSTLIEALKKEGIDVKEKVLRKDEMHNYKGFFLTSTSSKVVPISQIDNKQIEVPGIVKETVKIYDSYLKEYEQKQLQI